jgi:hypothetical protein
VRAALALIAVLMLSVTAFAQETGTLLPHPPATAEGTGKVEVRNVMRQFARCALSKSPGFVAKLLDAPSGSPDYERWIRRVSDGECLGFTGSLRFNSVDMRGTLFEASYTRFFGHDSPTDFAAVPAIDYPGRYGQPGNATADRAVALAEFADCAARADGSDAKALIISPPGSAAETTAIGGLRSHLARCLEKGRGITFDRSTLRGAIAEGTYRLTQSAATMAKTAAR